ncbi:MmgE/PrpD family protein [Aquincola sp. MAHUQ-54]|uniref:MmgE/PrpD family protein n=1 Tax=Aquincola agrisoli TaxID=3119538 RepID=A0AAW9QCJ9_9BURK
MPTTIDAGLPALAQAAQAWTLSRCPPEIVAQARLCILDTAGCIVAGGRTEEAALILRCEGDAAGAAATVLGTPARQPLLSTVRIHGYLGDVLELNDLIGGHASIGVVSAALSLAEVRGAPLGTMVEAVLRGIEVTHRIYSAVYPSLKRFTESGLVPVGIPSSIGAAAAASRLLDLDAERTAHAMAIAGALAGWCPAEVIFGDGGTLKPMLFGAQTGATGVTAALYAQQGMTGPLRLLESRLGYFATAATAARLQAELPPERWGLAAPRRKLHACCGYLHSAVDAAVRLRAQAPLTPHTTLEVHVPPYTADAVDKPRPPVSANDARFHLQYCLALVLCGADRIDPEHSLDHAGHLARDDVAAAMDRIHVVPDGDLTHYHQCRLLLKDAQGAVLAAQALDAPRGSPAEPLADDDVIDKFRRIAGPSLPPGRADRFIGQLMAGEDHAPAAGCIATLAT